MNTRNYGRFLKAIGHRVITSPSGYWFDISHSFYQCIPPFRIIAPTRTEIEGLLQEHNAVGLKYCAPHDHVGKHGWIYICENKDYDLHLVHPKMRNKVRQGMRNCTVRPITFEYLYKHGMLLNRDTLERQGRNDPIFCQPARWARLCEAGHEIEGAGAWGALAADQLAAYMITFQIDDHANILYQMSRTDLLASHANNVLAFVATKEMLSWPAVHYVSYGQASIRQLAGLDEYKVRLGYRKRHLRYRVILHPLIRPFLLSWLGEALVRSLNRFLSEKDVVKRISGVVDIARQSQQETGGVKSNERKSDNR